MMDYGGAKLKIVEVPAIVEGSAEGKANGMRVLSVVRAADALVLLVRGADDEAVIKNELGKADIKVGREKPKIEIKPSKFRGITIAGRKFLKMREPELVDMLRSMGMHNASVLLREETTVEKIAEVLDERIVYKKVIVVNTAGESSIDELKGRIFGMLDRIRVYTKKPGEEADMREPLVLKRGATVKDVAERLHKDFARKLRYVRVWGSSKFPGQRVARGYELKDGDTIEIYS